MPLCFFVSDLHGHINRYEKLFSLVKDEKPDAVFFGGDLFPHALKKIENYDDFIEDFLFSKLRHLKRTMNDQYPKVFLILGNDDARCEEEILIEESDKGLFHYINQLKVNFKKYSIFGYSFVPPTPFQMKDWEKYDVSRYVDPGCIHPTEGFRTLNINEDIEYATIQNDLITLTESEDVSNAIFLFHTPPYKTKLDRAALDGKFYENVPLDVHVGSIAVERFIKTNQPLITLHGHVHESTAITGEWKEYIGKTLAMNAAHNGPELSLIRFDPENPKNCSRELFAV